MAGGEGMEGKCSGADWNCWTGAADVDGTSRTGQREEKISNAVVLVLAGGTRAAAVGLCDGRRRSQTRSVTSEALYIPWPWRCKQLVPVIAAMNLPLQGPLLHSRARQGCLVDTAMPLQGHEGIVRLASWSIRRLYWTRVPCRRRVHVDWAAGRGTR